MNDPQPAPLPIPKTTVTDFVSSVNGRGYRLMVTPPATPAPEAGWPVLWMLDGQGYNGFVLDLVRNRGTIGGEIATPLVVSVGYPVDDIAQFLSRRSFDLTPTPGDAEHMLADAPGHRFGGLDGFLDMLQTEAMPMVARHHAVNAAQMALAGHSLGGLATLYTLFTRPDLFQSHIALCPSIWWDQRVLLRHEAAFEQRVRSGGVSQRLFIAVGGTEQDPLTQPAGVYAERFERAQTMHQRSRMVDNAAELADRLARLPGAPGYAVRYECPAGETHMTTPFVSLGHALDLAFPRVP